MHSSNDLTDTRYLVHSELLFVFLVKANVAVVASRLGPTLIRSLHPAGDSANRTKYKASTLHRELSGSFTDSTPPRSIDNTLNNEF